jgi:hypothetical protein
MTRLRVAPGLKSMAGVSVIGDATTKAVRVTRYVRRKRTDLINLGEQLLTPAELRERLPQLALEAARRIGKGG